MSYHPPAPLAYPVYPIPRVEGFEGAEEGTKRKGKNPWSRRVFPDALRDPRTWTLPCLDCGFLVDLFDSFWEFFNQCFECCFGCAGDCGEIV